MSELGALIDEMRAEFAVEVAGEIYPCRCRILVDGAEVAADEPCEYEGGGSDSSEGSAFYTFNFRWTAPAEVGALVVVAATGTRQEMTFQLRGRVREDPLGVEQTWRAVSSPDYGQVNYGI